jgi:hypothetical protein
LKADRQNHTEERDLVDHPVLGLSRVVVSVVLVAVREGLHKGQWDSASEDLIPEAQHTPTLVRLHVIGQRLLSLESNEEKKERGFDESQAHLSICCGQLAGAFQQHLRSEEIGRAMLVRKMFATNAQKGAYPPVFKSKPPKTKPVSTPTPGKDSCGTW